MCLFCTSFLLPKCAHSSSNVAVNWGSGEELCDISTWKSPEVIILLSGPQFFSAMKQGSWTRKCLRSSFHNPISWAPPAVFGSLPFCYQRSPPATLHAQSGFIPTLSLQQLLKGNSSSSQNEKKVGSSFLEALFQFPSLVIKVDGREWRRDSQLISQTSLHFQSSGPLFQLVLLVTGRVNKHHFLEKVRASTSLRLREGNVTHSHLAARPNEA